MSRVAMACAGAALALGAIAGPAAADGARLDAAWAVATGEVDGLVDASDLAAINVIGYHAAVSKLCDGFALDVDEIAAATDALIADAPADATPETLLARQAEILIAVGTAHGLFLAEGSQRLESFCEEAIATRDDPDYDDHWQ